MHPLILDALSKGKDRVAGRINHVSMLDDDRAVVLLDSKQEIHIHVKPGQYERLQGGLLEEAIFIGVFDLEILKCTTVIFNKRPTNQ
jgi:hypothetical protein